MTILTKSTKILSKRGKHYTTAKIRLIVSEGMNNSNIKKEDFQNSNSVNPLFCSLLK